VQTNKRVFRRDNLVHGDLHAGNVMFDEVGDTCTVIDGGMREKEEEEREGRERRKREGRGRERRKREKEEREVRVKKDGRGWRC